MTPPSPPPERLIVVGPLPPPHHGVSVMTRYLLDALEGDGLVAAHLDTADDREVHNAGRFDMRNVWLALRHAFEFVVLLGRERDAAVYVPISQNRLGLLRDAVFLVAARTARRRRYVHLHGGHFARFYEGADAATRLVARLAVGGAHQVWVLTPSLAGMFDGIVPRDRVHVLENVVPEPELVGASADADLTPRILFLSNLTPEKGPFELLDALDILGDDARGYEVHLVGEGEPHVRAEIDKRAAGLAQRGVTVKRLGSLTGADKARELAWANVFALPTYYPLEGQPLVLLEAMAAGLAIVSTRHAGIPDTVRHGEEALLSEPRDAQGLAAALHELARDSDSRGRLGHAARARWESHYSPERYGSNVRALLSGEAGPAAARTRSTASTANEG